MSVEAPRPLRADHQRDDFDCGKASLNNWLIRLARQAQVGSAKTYVVEDGTRVVGYFSLTVGQIDTLEVAERVRKGVGNYGIPVIILAISSNTNHSSQGK